MKVCVWCMLLTYRTGNGFIKICLCLSNVRRISDNVDTFWIYQAITKSEQLHHISTALWSSGSIYIWIRFLFYSIKQKFQNVLGWKVTWTWYSDSKALRHYCVVFWTLDTWYSEVLDYNTGWHQEGHPPPPVIIWAFYTVTEHWSDSWTTIKAVSGVLWPYQHTDPIKIEILLGEDLI